MFKFLANKFVSKKNHIDIYDIHSIVPNSFVKGNTMEFMYWATHPDTLIQRYRQENVLSIRHKRDKEHFMFLVDHLKGNESTIVYKHEKLDLPENVQKAASSDPDGFSDKLLYLYTKELQK
ncbi:hypothetical protein [Moritella marina]|uniref:hypothetical protein n=1 Tax=Moritella marina TaxID=90736 RepID=UPI0037037309